MDVNSLITKIKQFHSDITQQMEVTDDAIERREMEVFLLALDAVMDMTKQAKEVTRMEQQLAKKRDLLEKGPDADWTRLSGKLGDTSTNSKAKTVPFLPNIDRDEEADGERLAA